MFRGDANRLSEGAFVWRGSGCSCSMGVANWSGFCSQRHQSAQPECHSCMCASLVLWFQTEPMNAASAKQGAAWAVVGVDCYFIFANASSLWILISFYFLATLLSSNTTWCKYSALFSLRFNLLIHICLSAHINFISAYVLFIFTLWHQTPALTYSKRQSINQPLILSVLFILWAKTHNCVTPKSHTDLLAKP